MKDEYYDEIMMGGMMMGLMNLSMIDYVYGYGHEYGYGD